MNDSLVTRPAAWGRAGFLRRLAGAEPAAPPSDRALVGRAAAGDSRAYGELYLRHVNDVFLYVRLRVRDEKLAEDLTQDVFMSTYEALPRFQWRGDFRPWLLRCAHNRVVNHWRAAGSRPPLRDLPAADDGSDPLLDLPDGGEGLRDAERGFEIDRVLAALPFLTEAQQQVIALRFGLELSVAETAAVLERSQSAIKNLQYEALKRFRAHLQPEGGAT